jgi:hypothetical protein
MPGSLHHKYGDHHGVQRNEGQQDRRGVRDARARRNVKRGYIRVTTKRGSHTIERTIGRGCGRPVKTEQEALELAEPEARRVLAL